MILSRDCLVVSCQAEGEDPFNTPEGVTMFAVAAELGGANCIRTEGVDKSRHIIEKVNIPVIGLVKGEFPNGDVCITRKIEDVGRLIDVGCEIIAIDGTKRLFDGLSGCEFIQKVKLKYNVEIMADISTLEEAIEVDKIGVNYVSTTLNGYTEYTLENSEDPNFDLVNQILTSISTPVFAEGRISNVIQAKKMVDLGVHGVVVGTWITRPRIITQKYKEVFINS